MDDLIPPPAQRDEADAILAHLRIPPGISAKVKEQIIALAMNRAKLNPGASEAEIETIAENLQPTVTDITEHSDTTSDHTGDFVAAADNSTADTSAAGDFASEYLDDMVREFADEFNSPVTRRDFDECVHDIHQKFANTEFANDRAAESFALATGVAIAQHNHQQFRSGVNIAANAMTGLTPDIKHKVGTALKGGDVRGAAGLMYDNSKQLQQNYAQAREKRFGRSNNPSEDRQHFIDDTVRVWNKMHRNPGIRPSHTYNAAGRAVPSRAVGGHRPFNKGALLSHASQHQPATKTPSIAALFRYKHRQPPNPNA